MDRRNRQDWFDRFDEKHMKIMVVIDDEELEFTAQYEVCDVCEGVGSHVNPNIDSHGLTYEDFAEDPDFKEAYFRGDYDIPCNQCNGKRVYPVVCRNLLSKEDEEKLDEHLTDRDMLLRIEASERRFGC